LAHSSCSEPANQGVYASSSGWGFLGPSIHKIEPTPNNQQVVHTGVNPTTNGLHLTTSSVARVKSRAAYHSIPARTVAVNQQYTRDTQR